MIKRWIQNIPIPGHIDWLTRDRVLRSGHTYHQPVRRIMWSLLDHYSKKDGNQALHNSFRAHCIAKFLNIMFRMEYLAGGENVGT